MPGTLGLSHRVPKRHSGGPSTQVAPHPPSPALCHAAPATAWAAGHVDGDHPVHILRAITGQCEGQTSGDHSDPGGGWEARVRNENSRPHCVGAPPRHRSTPSPPDPRAPRSGTDTRRGAGGTALPALWEGGGAGHARRKRTRCRGSHAPARSLHAGATSTSQRGSAVQDRAAAAGAPGAEGRGPASEGSPLCGPEHSGCARDWAAAGSVLPSPTPPAAVGTRSGHPDPAAGERGPSPWPRSRHAGPTLTPGTRSRTRAGWRDPGEEEK